MPQLFLPLKKNFRNFLHALHMPVKIRTRFKTIMPLQLRTRCLAKHCLLKILHAVKTPAEWELAQDTVQGGGSTWQK